MQKHRLSCDSAVIRHIYELLDVLSHPRPLSAQTICEGKHLNPAASFYPQKMMSTSGTENMILV
jgi:hypothetical protein